MVAAVRIVKRGRPSRLYRLKRRDLPADSDLSHSFFEYVDLSGFDLSSYDARDMDVFDCLAQNVVLPDRIRWMQSRRTDWAGSHVPDTVSHNHDLMKERLRRLPPDPRLQRLLDYGLSDYSHSFNDTIHHLISQGQTREEVRAYLDGIFSSLPRVLAEFRDQIAVDTFTAQPVQPPDLTRVPVAGATRRDRLVNISGELLVTNDRYEQARHLETLHPDVRFWLPMSDPFPIVLASHRRVDFEPDYPWWSDMWVT